MTYADVIVDITAKALDRPFQYLGTKNKYRRSMQQYSKYIRNDSDPIKAEQSQHYLIS